MVRLSDTGSPGQGYPTLYLDEASKIGQCTFLLAKADDSLH